MFFGHETQEDTASQPWISWYMPGSCVRVQVASAKPELLVTSETQGLKIAPGKSLSRVAVRKQKLRHQVLNPGSMKGSEELARCRITMSVDNLPDGAPRLRVRTFLTFRSSHHSSLSPFCTCKPGSAHLPDEEIQSLLYCVIYFSRTVLIGQHQVSANSSLGSRLGTYFRSTT